MRNKIIDGKEIASRIKKEIVSEISLIKKERKFLPKLVSLIVGDIPQTVSYCNSQRKVCLELGIEFEIIKLNENISQQQLANKIEKLNGDNLVGGIILNLPLPSHIKQYEVQNKISQLKDVECVTSRNLGELIYTDKEPKIYPCTAQAVVECLRKTRVSLKGKEIVIVGHSEIVGKPLSMLLLKSKFNSPTVTVCHISTRDLLFHTKRAEILIVAVGKPNFVNSSMIKKGSIIIDVGINKLNDSIVGDVNFNDVIKKASKITPVPGGVGAITSYLLIKNFITLCKIRD